MSTNWGSSQRSSSVVHVERDEPVFDRCRFGTRAENPRVASSARVPLGERAGALSGLIDGSGVWRKAFKRFARRTRSRQGSWFCSVLVRGRDASIILVAKECLPVGASVPAGYFLRPSGLREVRTGRKSAAARMRTDARNLKLGAAGRT